MPFAFPSESVFAFVGILKLGMEHVPVVVLDHLTDTQKRAYILADNRLAEQAGWDDDLLRGEISKTPIWISRCWVSRRTNSERSSPTPNLRLLRRRPIR
ncbi:MAG TPA: hypothetical protein VKX39_02795 [Bryobacteraceae bacterium]|jgi:ParB-like chromosome segregation protein Spo0J|nr:hypothetical protein [Bryobacteraceae bacterium]